MSKRCTGRDFGRYLYDGYLWIGKTYSQSHWRKIKKERQ
jgi:hypothetical protein